VSDQSYVDEDPVEFFEDRFSLQPKQVIARGGMGVVYEAEMLGCEGFAKRVAVKMLRKKWSTNANFVELLVAEAKLVSDLVHENIAQMYMLGETPTGRRYIVMEHVHGLSLFDILVGHWRKKTLLPQPLAIHIVSRIARGLGYAHNFRDGAGTLQHIVHRDVCPSNILVTTEGLAKLIDFGVAKARTMTIIGDDWQTGKMAYMSPEQALRKPVDFRTDIFALGAVLFEVLAGRPLRDLEDDATPADVAEMSIPWHYLDGKADEELRVILAKMMARNPAERYDDANDVAHALEEYIYRDGYGPTIQTVEVHLREEFPRIYQYPDSLIGVRIPDHPTVTFHGRDVEDV
jgi:serine/threonine protein kinase